MKIKVGGFTLIEMFVTMGFMALLATMTVPNFMEMYQRYLFRGQIIEVYDILLDARSNAITAKNCSNYSFDHDNLTGTEPITYSESWEVRIIKDISAENPFRVQLRCNIQGDTRLNYDNDDETRQQESELVLEDNHSIKSMDLFDDNTTTVPTHEGNMTAKIQFFTDSVRAKISSNISPYEKGDNARIVFQYKNRNVFNAVCLNRITAFPIRKENIDPTTDSCVPL